MPRPVLAVLLAALATPAFAAAPAAVPPVAFTGTVVSTYPDGRTAKLWLEPGGTYRGQGRRGGLSRGSWKVEGDRICLRQSRPFPYPKSYCTRMVDGGVGTTWQGKAVTGEDVTMTLVAGR
jgi:hypothetical protein